MSQLTLKERNGIQYSIQNNKRWLYNIRNDRMIVSEQSLENYLKDADQVVNPLYDFYSSPYKRGKTSNFHLIRIILDSVKIKSFYKAVLFLNRWYITLFMLIVNILYLPQLTQTLPDSIGRITIVEMLGLYTVTSLIILPLHEYAHFAVYYKYFTPPKVTFGFSLRYFSMLVFFIKVPFYKLLAGKEKRKLILSGVQFQVAVWFFLTLLNLIYPNQFTASVIVLNISIIITNLLPFLKLDGYWYLSDLLGVDDYMLYFKEMFSKHYRFRLDVLVLGCTNIILMLLSIITMLSRIWNIFT